MPNWCSNTIKVRLNKKGMKFISDGLGLSKPPGTTSELKDKLSVGITALTLRSWMPMPQIFEEFDTTNDMLERDAVDHITNKPKFSSDIAYENYTKSYNYAKKEQLEKYGYIGWYSYNLATLGCKWDCEINEYDIKNNELILYCYSPWSPPVEWFHTVCQKYQLIAEMTSEEPGSELYKNYYYDGKPYSWYEEDFEPVKLEDEEDEDF